MHHHTQFMKFWGLDQGLCSYLCPYLSLMVVLKLTCVYICVCHDTHVETKEQLMGVSPLLSLRGSQGWSLA